MFSDRNEIFPTSEDLSRGWLKEDHNRLEEPLRSINSALVALWHGNEDAAAAELWDLVAIEGEDEETGEPFMSLTNQKYPEAVYLLGVIESLQPDPSQALSFLKSHRGLSPAIDFEIQKLEYRDLALCPVIPEQGTNDYAMGSQWYVHGGVEKSKGNLSAALTYWGFGALHGNTESTYAIGLEATKASDFLTAEACWTQLGTLGHGTSMMSLGNLYNRTVGPFLAKYWWDAAFREGTHERRAGPELSSLKFYDEELAERLSKAEDRWWDEDSS